MTLRPMPFSVAAVYAGAPCYFVVYFFKLYMVVCGIVVARAKASRSGANSNFKARTDSPPPVRVHSGPAYLACAKTVYITRMEAGVMPETMPVIIHSGLSACLSL